MVPVSEPLHIADLLWQVKFESQKRGMGDKRIVLRAVLGPSQYNDLRAHRSSQFMPWKHVAMLENPEEIQTRIEMESPAAGHQMMQAFHLGDVEWQGIWIAPCVRAEVSYVEEWRVERGRPWELLATYVLPSDPKAWTREKPHGG